MARLPIRDIVLYGCYAALLIGVLEAARFRFAVADDRFEGYAIVIALVFTGIGMWAARTTSTPKKEIVVVREPSPIPFEIDQAGRERLGISRREMEVLTLMAAGHSNEEIARSLFISANTVKTHTSSLYAKLGVKRRTQAVEMAKKQRLIA